MQTFLPYPDFQQSMRALDWQRLGKQRVEAYQLLRALGGLSKGWTTHAATRMWRGYEPALEQYMRAVIVEWKARGYVNNMAIPEAAPATPPPWLGDDRLHASHRANLLRKLPAHYQQFGWTEDPAMPYYWPVPATPPPPSRERYTTDFLGSALGVGG